MTSLYTISIISPAGGAIRQMAVSKKMLHLGIGLAMLVAIAIVIGSAQFFSLRGQTGRLQALSGRLETQDSLVEMQRRQIQTFATDINGLKDRLVKLNEFETKIRVIANIGISSESTGIFGMGGASPEALDPHLPLGDAHRSLMRDMHEQTQQLQVASIQQEQRFSTLLENLKNQVDRLAATPSIRPAKGWITSRFEKRTSPFTGRPEFHHALDIASDAGTPLLATANGVIAFAGNKWLLGKTIVIDHGHGMITRYGHCQKLLKKAGDPVKRGSVIALMGNTGRSTGPHVHYEVRFDGVPVNPERYILD